MNKTQNVFSSNKTMAISVIVCYDNIVQYQKEGASGMEKILRRTLYINEDKYKELQEHCRGNGMTVNGLIKVLLEKYMREVKGESSTR